MDKYSGRLPTTSKTQVTEWQVAPLDSYKHTSLTGLWLHGVWHGRNPYQFVCTPPWRFPRSICFSWYLWWRSSSEWITAVDPRILTESCRHSFNCLTGQSFHSDSDGLRWAVPKRRSIAGPVTVAGSWLEILLPARVPPPVGTGSALVRKHVCLERHGKHGGMSVVSPKPKLTGTLSSWSTILVEWRHRRFLLHHGTPRRMVDSLMLIVWDVGCTWAWFFTAPVVPAE